MKNHKMAMSILREEEKASLSLQHSHNKSTWQAGEILNKSHYKYLEIKIRAEKFFKTFATYFEYAPELIISEAKFDPRVKAYFEYAILGRLPVKSIIEKIGDEKFKDRKFRDELIIQHINRISKSPSLMIQNMYQVIMDFDRYNNFRILPKDIQEPSAFKRRNSSRYKKHLKIATSLSLYTIHRLKELFEQNNGSLLNEGFLVIIQNTQESEIIRVNVSEKNLDRFSKISLYVFKDKAVAEEFMELVSGYVIQKKKDPKKGLIFWPHFRNLIRLSLNYDQVNAISPTRKSLEIALKDMDIYYYNKRNKEKFQTHQDSPNI